MASAAFSIGANSSLAMATVAGSSVTTIALDSTDGVRTSSVSIVSTDETTDASDWVIADSTATSTTITAPGSLGSAAIIQWTVNGGVTTDRTTGQSSTGDLVKTAKIVVLSAGSKVVACSGETYETDATHGWTPLFNEIIRNGAGAANLDPNGTLNIATSLTDDLNVGSATCSVVVAADALDVTVANDEVHTVGGFDVTSSGTSTIASAGTSGISTTGAAAHITLQTSGASGAINLTTTNGGPISLGTTNGAISVDSDGEALTLAAGAGAATLSGATSTISGTTTVCAGATESRVLSPTCNVGVSITGSRTTTDVDTTSHRRRVYGTANTLGLTETVNAAGCTLAAVGTLAVTSGSTVSISDTDGPVLTADGAGNNGLTATGDLTLTSPLIYLNAAETVFPVGGASLNPLPRTTDAAPGVLTVRGGSAYGTATGANKVGAALRLGGGRGDDPGTDLGGDVKLSLGRHIVDNSTASLRVTYGDATDDDFENTLFQIYRSSAARCRLEPAADTQCVVSGFFNLNSSSFISLEATTYLSAYAGDGRFIFYGPSVLERCSIQTPAKVVPGSAAATAIGSFTVPASTAGCFVGSINARNGAGNAKSWSVEIEYDADGATATIQAAGRVFTVRPGNVGTITTVAGDFTTSVAGLVVTVTAANASGYTMSLSGRLEI